MSTYCPVGPWRHWRRGEPLCDQCSAARRRYQRAANAARAKRPRTDLHKPCDRCGIQTNTTSLRRNSGVCCDCRDALAMEAAS